MTLPTDNDAVAQAVAVKMLERDRASEKLGIKLTSIGTGSAVLSMKVQSDMLNGHGICHGGIVFTLADTAFAFACNSRNIKTVALTGSINFVSAAQEGDLLTARAVELSLLGRTGVYDITVVNQHGASVAHFRGTSYGTSCQVLDKTDD